MKIRQLFDPRRCGPCSRCAVSCPTEAITRREDALRIDPARCIGCAVCLSVCPKAGLAPLSGTDRVRKLIGAGRVAACYDPEIQTLLPETDLPELLQALGFSEARSVSGARQTAAQAADRLPNTVVLSAVCPAITRLICLAYPEAVPLLAPLRPPAELCAGDIKQRDPACKVVNITTCPALEAAGKLDAVLSLRDLLSWAEAAGLAPLRTAEAVVCEAGPAFERRHYRVCGLSACRTAISAAAAGTLPAGVIDLYACPNGCLSAPSGLCPTVLFPAPVPKEAKSVAALSDRGLKKRFQPLPQPPLPSEAELMKAKTALGIFFPSDAYDCGACGYASCEAAAAAVCRGDLPAALCTVHKAAQSERLLDALLAHTADGVLVLKPDRTLVAASRQAEQLLCGEHGEEGLQQAVDRYLDLPTLQAEAAAAEAPSDVFPEVHGQRLRLRSFFLKSAGLLLCLLQCETETVFAEERRERLARETVCVSDRVLRRNAEMVRALTEILGENALRNEADLRNLQNIAAYD